MRDDRRKAWQVGALVSLAEICVGDADPATVADRIRIWGVEILDVPAAAADVCATAYRQYRNRRLSQSDVPLPNMPLPDFFIGAHAKIMGWELATTDRSRFSTYFPSVSQSPAMISQLHKITKSRRGKFFLETDGRPRQGFVNKYAREVNREIMFLDYINPATQLSTEQSAVVLRLEVVAMRVYLLLTDISNRDTMLTLHVITRRRLIEFAREHPDARVPLNHWYTIVSKTEYASFVDLRITFPTADQVGKFTVFNIAGNKYRLIVAIHYNRKKVYIRHVLTHAEYSRSRWRK